MTCVSRQQHIAVCASHRLNLVRVYMRAHARIRATVCTCAHVRACMRMRMYAHMCVECGIGGAAARGSQDGVPAEYPRYTAAHINARD